MAYIESGLSLSYSKRQSSFADLCFTTYCSVELYLSMEIEDSAGYRRENSWKEASESFLCSLLSEEIISLLLFWHAFIVDRVLWGQPTLYGGLCSLWFMARLWSVLSLRPARSRPCCTPPPASCRSPRHRSPRPRTWTWSLGIIF